MARLSRRLLLSYYYKIGVLMNEEKSKSIIWPLIITIIFTAIISSSASWLYFNQKNKGSLKINSYQENEQKDDDTQSKDKPENDQLSWKTYESSAYSIGFRHPSDWEVEENLKSTSNEAGYVIAGNIFSYKNIFLVNKNKNYTIAFNIDSEFGRGGTCVKRSAFYDLNMLESKLNFEKVIDNMRKENPPGDMCEGIQKGFVIRTSEIYHKGQKIIIHSENGTVSDEITEDAIKTFEEIIQTMFLI
jgi:hypothetical protein